VQLDATVFAVAVQTAVPGARGPKGEPAPSITAWKIDREHYRAVPLSYAIFSRSFSTRRATDAEVTVY